MYVYCSCIFTIHKLNTYPSLNIDFKNPLQKINTNQEFGFRLLFEMPPTGGVVPSYKFHAIYLMRNSLLSYIFSISFIVMIGFYTLEVLRNILYFKLKYFTFFWSYIEIMIITVTADLFQLE